MNTITTYAPAILTVAAAATVAFIIRSCTRGKAPAPRVEQPIDEKPTVALIKRKADRSAPTKPTWHALVDNFANLPGTTAAEKRIQKAKYNIYRSAVFDTDLPLEIRIQLATKCLLKLKNIVLPTLATDGMIDRTGLRAFFSNNIHLMPNNICEFIESSTDEAIIDPTLHYISALLTVAEVDEENCRLYYADNAWDNAKKLRNILLEKFEHLAQDDRILAINQKLDALEQIILKDDSEELEPISSFSSSDEDDE